VTPWHLPCIETAHDSEKPGTFEQLFNAFRTTLEKEFTLHR